MLEVTDLNAYYGKSHILRGVNLKIEEGEIVSLLGRNGVGRSTTCKAIMGEVEPIGSVKFNGDELAGKKAFEIAKLGLGYVPENRDIFPGLTTRQNLELGIKNGQDMAKSRWSLDDMFNLFENLKNRADVEASFLSGGEQQMLTMCRTLMGDPEVIMIDEPTEGLSPQMTTRVADLLNEISSRGVSILLVEQNAKRALNFSNRGYVLDQGRNAYHGQGDELLNDPRVIDLYLGKL